MPYDLQNLGSPRHRLMWLFWACRAASPGFHDIPKQDIARRPSFDLGMETNSADSEF
jgi:hypothetical protein